MAVRAFAGLVFVLALASGCEANRPVTTRSSVDPPRASQPAPPTHAAMADAPPVDDYDLVADRERRSEEARRELGARSTVTVESDVFVVAGASGWGPAALDASVKLTRDALAGFFNGRFGRRPARAISVYLFPSDAPYQS